jgi:hypothetical protein
MLLVLSAFVLFIVAILLLLHHAHIHAEDLTGTDQYFQLSDVCNFHSCSHEMWILLLVTAAMILIATHLCLMI